MPKLKTKKAAAKRYKVKSNGDIKRGQANKGHILTKKPRKRKNKLKKTAYVSSSDKQLAMRCLRGG